MGKGFPYKVCVVAACDRQGVIGIDGKLPWHCPEDMRHFRFLTTGKIVLMGRKTAESLKTPLRDRINLVLTRDKTWAKPGFIAVRNRRGIVKALKEYDQHEIWVIGGQDLYNRYTPHADIVHLTVLNTVADTSTADPDTVRYFPMPALKTFKGVHAQCTEDPNVVFWVFTPHQIQTGRAKPISAAIV